MTRHGHGDQNHTGFFLNFHPLLGSEDVELTAKLFAFNRFHFSKLDFAATILLQVG
jgi:hypothetical protein